MTETNDQRASAVEGSADITPTGTIPVPPIAQSEAHQRAPHSYGSRPVVPRLKVSASADANG